MNCSRCLTSKATEVHIRQNVYFLLCTYCAMRKKEELTLRKEAHPIFENQPKETA
jgi:hypothetical protein